MIPLRFLTLGLIVAAVAAPAKAQSFYQIGNSLTWDSKPEGIALMAASAGIDIDGGYHVRSNSSPGEIWDAPEDYTFVSEQHGSYQTALVDQAWDHIAIQTSDNGGETIEDNLQAIEQFVDLAEQNSPGHPTQYYLYGAWPWFTRWAGFGREEVDALDTPVFNRKNIYYHLLDRLNEEDPNRFLYIPAGEVLETIMDRLDGVAFDGHTSIFRYYNDVIHLNGRGEFAAATTVLATVFRINPIGLEVPRSINGWGAGTISDELALEIQEVVWEVVVNQKRTGVSPYGDINVDTLVDAGDYALWEQAYGFQDVLSADANGDGVVDETDGELLVNATDPGVADIDGDSRVDENDRDVWWAAYGSAGPNAADLNADGLVNAVDYTIWRDKYALIQSTDFDGNGVAGAGDFAIWERELGWSVDLPADVNGDGVVNAIDYTMWRDNFRPLSTGAAAPEPTAAAMAFAAMAGSLFCRFRLAA